MADRFTAQLTPETITTISGQYFDLDQPFAVPRYQNECTPYTTGRDYMKAVADAIRGAKKFIFITDWQLDYDVELDNRGDPKHPGRLSELLADALQRGVFRPHLGHRGNMGFRNDQKMHRCPGVNVMKRIDLIVLVHQL